MKDLASRLLDLEQRFESYCNLHGQEIAEIRQSLHDLRTELLRANGDNQCDITTTGFAVTQAPRPEPAADIGIADELSI